MHGKNSLVSGSWTKNENEWCSLVILAIATFATFENYAKKVHKVLNGNVVPQYIYKHECFSIHIINV